jgi:ribonuclease HIII
LKKAGVRDSKSVGSDREIARLAALIRGTPGCVSDVVTIGNEAYNRMYKNDNMGSVNRILAWAHARVIENLRQLEYQMNPKPKMAVIDQFASTEETVKRALMTLGRGLKIVQRHKAESDVAVAAASILARDEFVKRLEKLGKKYQLKFPKGASAEVDAVAKAFFERYGEEELKKVAKIHFRTYYRATGQPEPPKVEWKNRSA